MIYRCRFVVFMLLLVTMGLVGCGASDVPEQEAIDQVKAADAREMEELGSLDGGDEAEDQD